MLLSSEVDAQRAGRMAGDLLVIVGESDTRKTTLTTDAVRAHLRRFPERRARYVVLPRCDYALCDTTSARWTGLDGLEGSCEVPRRVYAEFEKFLRKTR